MVPERLCSANFPIWVVLIFAELIMVMYKAKCREKDCTAPIFQVEKGLIFTKLIIVLDKEKWLERDCVPPICIPFS